MISTANAILFDQQRGIFVTNAHVVNAGRRLLPNNIYVGLPHARRWQLAKMKWADPDIDLAYLRLDTDLSAYPSVPIKTSSPKIVEVSHGDSDFRDTYNLQNTAHISTLKKFAKIMPADDGCTTAAKIQGYGHPFPDIPTSSDVKIYSTLRNAIFYSANPDFTQPGRSGSAVLDSDGNLIGIHNIRNLGGGIAVPSHRVSIPPSMFKPFSAPGPRNKFKKAVTYWAGISDWATAPESLPWPAPTP